MTTLRSKWLCGLLFLATSSSLFAQHYTRTDLTENAAGVSASATVHIDANLVNAWGLARGSGSPWWVADNGTGKSTLYDSTGTPQSLVVTIPPPLGQDGSSAPTGTAFNFTTGFQVAANKPAVFLFATEDGTISGWNPTVDATNAIRKVNRPQKAIYKGLAIAMSAAGPRLYATNFKSGEVEVFDAGFNRIYLGGEAFRSEAGEDYAPFGIQNVGGNLVVTFAKREPGSTDELHGAGLGRVMVFDPNGRLLLRLQKGSWLNAPWGIALAPGDFGAFSHRLLIGNFGDGTIQVFNTITGRHEGQLLDSAGRALAIDGLWSLSFGGDSARNGLATELFFTAGPNDEHDGLLGKVTAVTTELRGNSE
jgi:uncharacterized protein (TIGR03118 family)